MTSVAYIMMIKHKKMKYSIDLNCDLGEGGGFDHELMKYISTCNIACGGHYGDQESIKKTVDLAVSNQVKIGAHPSYPDRDNFGRSSMNISKEKLKSELKKQIVAVKDEVERQGGKLHHIKPHGALYNDLIKDKDKAQTVIDVVKEIDNSLVLFVPPKSVVKTLGNNALKIWTEGFADRNYHSDFSLVSRQKDNAVLIEKKRVFDRVFSIAAEGKIKAINGDYLEANFNTICLHSDTKNSIDILEYLVWELPKQNIEIL